MDLSVFSFHRVFPSPTWEKGSQKSQMSLNFVLLRVYESCITDICLVMWAVILGVAVRTRLETMAAPPRSEGGSLPAPESTNQLSQHIVTAHSQSHSMWLSRDQVTSRWPMMDGLT